MRSRGPRAPVSKPYLRAISLKPEKTPPSGEYPFSIAAVRHLGQLEFDPHVTFLVGENGTGKSTLLEAVAVALGLNAEGGGRNFNFATRASHSCLHQHLRLVRSYSRPRDTYFLRAESFYNVATEIEKLDEEPGLGPPITPAYGGPLHEKSHGESFFGLIMNRLRGTGLYLFDEPESALSVRRQLILLRRMRELVHLDSQFIIATHSPILLGYPNARIVVLDNDGYSVARYEETDPYRVTKAFLDDPATALAKIFQD